MVVAACGRISFDLIGGVTDAETDGGPDAGPLSLSVTTVTASMGEPGDAFGKRLALSGDGSTLAVAAEGEDSAARGIDGDETNNSAPNSGAVYVFVRSGAGWVQQAYLKASSSDGGDEFGNHVALSADGNTLAVTASREDSAGRGVGADESDNNAANSGAAYVFTRVGTTWSQQAYIKASNADTRDAFGTGVALSADGNTLAVAAGAEASAATGVDGNQANNSAAEAGAVYVFTRTGSTWSQQAYLKATNTEARDQLQKVALSPDGTTLAGGALYEDSSATGIDGNQLDNSAEDSGAIYIYERSGATWTPTTYVKASNTGAGDGLGFAFGLSNEGTLVAGAFGEASATRDDPVDDSLPGSGAAYVVRKTNGTWAHKAYLKPLVPKADAFFGIAAAISADGRRVVVGAHGETSGDPLDPHDNSAPYSGAIYVFDLVGETWVQRAYVKAPQPQADAILGYFVTISHDGRVFAAGAEGSERAYVFEVMP